MVHRRKGNLHGHAGALPAFGVADTSLSPADKQQLDDPLAEHPAEALLSDATLSRLSPEAGFILGV